MSDYVVDASVVIQRLIKDAYTENARVLFGQLATSDNLIVPEFCILECSNVLWKQVRFQGMPQSQAESLVNALTALPLSVVSVTHFLRRNLEIGLTHQLAIYDSVYITLAETLNHPLIRLMGDRQKLLRPRV